MKKIVISVIMILLLIGSFGAWYILHDSKKLNVSTHSIDSTNLADIKEQSTPDGTWTVKRQNDVFAGYEIKELYGGATVETTASGKSRGVSGAFVVKKGVISHGNILVDMRKLESNKDGRDERMRINGLETDSFPHAIFRQSGSVTLPSPLEKGVETSVDMKGALALHGTTQDVTIPLKATWDGRTIKVSGELEIALSNYKIVPPDSGFVSVTDHGKLKFQLLFILRNSQ